MFVSDDEGVVSDVEGGFVSVEEEPDFPPILMSLLSTFINPHAEDMSIAKSDNPNVIDKFGESLLGLYVYFGFAKPSTLDFERGKTDHIQ